MGVMMDGLRALKTALCGCAAFHAWIGVADPEEGEEGPSAETQAEGHVFLFDVDRVSEAPERYAILYPSGLERERTELDGWTTRGGWVIQFDETVAAAKALSESLEDVAESVDDIMAALEGDGTLDLGMWRPMEGEPSRTPEGTEPDVVTLRVVVTQPVGGG